MEISRINYEHSRVIHQKNKEMNTRKSWLFSLILFAFVSTATFAVESVAKDPTSFHQQIHQLLKNVDLDNSEDKVVYIDFMLNDKAEIIILSTTDKNMDLTLKSALNYKVIKTNELSYFKRYTVPLRIDMR